MHRYSIKYLENISGIKAHTIRIWEKRYKLLKPKRTRTNIRYYDNHHLKALLNIATLLNSGYKISAIASLSDREMKDELKKCLEKADNEKNLFEYFVNEIIICSYEFDKTSFERIFNSCMLKFGFYDTIEQVIYPALRRMGNLWQLGENSPAHEHFLSALIKQKLWSSIDGIPEPLDPKAHCMLYLPEEEEHELGLLYFNSLLVRNNIKTVYLGPNLPIENLIQAAKIVNPTHFVLFFVRMVPVNKIVRYVMDLSETFPKQKILLCGNIAGLHGMKLPSNITCITGPEHSRTFFGISKNV
jgi:DNA-binding transcriptional MerR regulator